MCVSDNATREKGGEELQLGDAAFYVCKKKKTPTKTISESH